MSRLPLRFRGPLGRWLARRLGLLNRTLPAPACAPAAPVYPWDEWVAAVEAAIGQARRRGYSPHQFFERLDRVFPATEDAAQPSTARGAGRLAVAVAAAAGTALGWCAAAAVPAAHWPHAARELGATATLAGMGTLCALYVMLTLLASIAHTHLARMMQRYGHWDDLARSVQHLACPVLATTSTLGLWCLFSPCTAAYAGAAGGLAATGVLLLGAGRRVALVFCALRRDDYQPPPTAPTGH